MENQQISSQAAKFFQDLLSSDQEEEVQAKEQIEVKEIPQHLQNQNEIQQVELNRDLDIPIPQTKAIKQSSNGIDLGFNNQANIESNNDSNDCAIMVSEQQKESVQYEEISSLNRPQILPQEKQSVVPDKNSQKLVQSQQQKEELIPNFFAEEDSLEIKLDSVLFSNSALNLQKTEKHQHQFNPLVQMKSTKEQTPSEKQTHCSLTKQIIKEDKKDERSKMTTLAELKNSIQEYLNNRTQSDQLIQALKTYKSISLKEFKQQLIKLLQETRSEPQLSLKEIYQKILQKELKIQNQESQVSKTEFTSLTRSQQVQLPMTIKNLPEVLIMSLMGFKVFEEDIINDYLENTYSIKDPFYILVKIFLGRAEEILERQEFIQSFPIKFYLLYLESKTSIIQAKIQRFWSLFLKKYGNQLCYRDLLTIGFTIGFKMVNQEIKLRINQTKSNETRQQMQCFYKLLNQELSFTERVVMFSKEDTLPEVQWISQNVQKKLKPISHPKKQTEIKEVKKQEITEKSEPRIQNNQQKKEQTQKQNQKQSGLLSFFKKLVTTDEPVKNPQEFIQKKPAQKAYYYDNELKTWIINGKPADNEHDDNILGLDQSKQDIKVNPPPPRDQQTTSPSKLSESSQVRKIMPPPKVKYQEKKSFVSSAAPPPPKLLPIPRPFDPQIIPTHADQAVKTVKVPAQISNPFTFSQSSGAGKVQNSRIRNLGSRYATPF